MRTALVVAALIGFTAPATAADCAYFSSSGQSVTFSADGDWITFDGGDGARPLTCPFDEAPYGWSSVDCGPWQGRMMTGSSVMGSGVGDILVFQTEFFYWLCPEAA